MSVGNFSRFEICLDCGHSGRSTSGSTETSNPLLIHSMMPMFSCLSIFLFLRDGLLFSMPIIIHQTTMYTHSAARSPPRCPRKYKVNKVGSGQGQPLSQPCSGRTRFLLGWHSLMMICRSSATSSCYAVRRYAPQSTSPRGITPLCAPDIRTHLGVVPSLGPRQNSNSAAEICLAT